MAVAGPLPGTPPQPPVPAAEPWCCGRPAAGGRRAAPTGSPSAGSCGVCAGSRWPSPAPNPPAAPRGNWDQLRALVWTGVGLGEVAWGRGSGQGSEGTPSPARMGWERGCACGVWGSHSQALVSHWGGREQAEPAGPQRGGARWGPPQSSHRRILVQQGSAELRGRHEDGVGEQEIPQEGVWKRAGQPPPPFVTPPAGRRHPWPLWGCPGIFPPTHSKRAPCRSLFAPKWPGKG